jgi:catechol 2,3-dioxygenase-like lactoylglutathione lyase family enzyme
MKLFLSFALAITVMATSAMAQLFAPNAEGVTMGHVHLNARDVNAVKAFYTDAMGGAVVKNGAMEMVAFPGVLILVTKAENPEPAGGSVVDHFGFTVKDMTGSLAKWKGMGLKIDPTPNPNEVYVWGPDGVKVEVYGVPEQVAPIQMNHIHYFAPDIPGMQAWYAKMFSATAGQRDCIACLPRKVPVEAGDMAGVSLSYSRGAPTVVGTKGRALDHIGFEVKNLDAFAKKLEGLGVKLEAPVRQLPNSAVKVAFLTDPWGTYIELTEGLGAAK